MEPSGDEESIHLVISDGRIAPVANANPADQTPELPLPIETARITSGRRAVDPIEVPFFPQSLAPHVCTRDDCTIKTVFATTELLEQILIHLQPAEILPLQLVNKKWQALINDSPSLYLSLFVEPRWGRQASDFQLLQLPTSMSPGLTIRKCEPIHLGQWVEVRMDGEAASQLNELCHDNAPDYMIVQPPLRSMLGFLINANSHASEQRLIPGDGPALRSLSTQDLEPHHKIHRDSGISLGQLARHADKALRESKHHDQTHVVFTAIVSFSAQTDAAPRMRSATTRVTTVG